MDGPSPQPALKGALLPRVIKKKSYNQRGGGGGQSVPFIHNIVNIHSLYYMCFSLVFACLSVRPGDGSQEPRPATPTPTFLPTLEIAKRGMVLKFRKSKQEGLLHSGSGVYRCVWVCMCMYVQGTCVQLCTKGRGSRSQRLGQMGLLEARPARTAGSQVDPPQVSRRCDGVALRAELLGTQSPQPALFTVHMPTLDGR